MKQSLEIKLGQSLKMTPQLQQSIRLLQLSLPELMQEIQQVMDENPLLEESVDLVEQEVRDQGIGEQDDAGVEGHTELDLETRTADPDSDTDDSWEEEAYEPSITMASAVPEGAEMDFDTRSSAPESLSDHLLWQARMTHLSERDGQIVEAVIQSIDDSGYLRASNDELMSMLTSLEELGPDEVDVGVKMVQSFDPPGVGARDLSERLSILLEALVDPGRARDTALKVVSGFLEEVAARDFVTIKRGLGLGQPELEDALSVLAQIDPRIDYSMGSTDTRYVSPDVIVRKLRGRWRVELNPAVSRKLHVNPEYEQLSKQSAQTEEGKYLVEKLQSAKWFIKGLQGRYETLIRVAEAIVARQTDFLEQGEIGMKPMILNDIADELGMHESTISRATSNKYMLTPRGVYELKYFFTSSVGGTDGDAVSSTAVRLLIKNLIDNEPAEKPISDNNIAKVLKEQGYSVARRTVAKYRESMNIPSSSKRKSLVL